MLAGTTAGTISFINGNALSNSAIHWYRVNYGASGPNYSKSRFSRPEGFPVRFLEQGLTLRDSAAPAPQSWLPRDFRFDRFGRFWPLRGPADVRGLGVRPARFTELGLESIADNLVPYYRQMFVEYSNTAAGAAKLADRSIKVPADPRARR